MFLGLKKRLLEKHAGVGVGVAAAVNPLLGALVADDGKGRAVAGGAMVDGLIGGLVGSGLGGLAGGGLGLAAGALLGGKKAPPLLDRLVGGGLSGVMAGSVLGGLAGHTHGAYVSGREANGDYDKPMKKEAMGPADARRLKHIAAGAGLGALTGHIFGDDDSTALHGAVIGGAAGAGYSKNTEEALVKLLQTRSALGKQTAKKTPGMWGTLAKTIAAPAAGMAALGAEFGPIHPAVGAVIGGAAGAFPGYAAYRHGLMPGILGMRQTKHHHKINMLEELAEKGRAEYAKRGVLGATAAGGATAGAAAAGHGVLDAAEHALGDDEEHENAGMEPEDRHNQAIEGLLAKMSAYNP